MKSNMLGILVVSWDGARELWYPFSECIKKYWRNCPVDMLLLAQREKASADLVFKKTITYESSNRDAVSRIVHALDIIEYEYIMIICDDYFCYERIENRYIEEYITFMKENSVDYMDFQGKVGKTKIRRKDSQSLFVISTGVPCVFRKDFLKEICCKIEAHSMREFEVRASEYVKEHRGQYKIYTCDNSNIMFMHGVLEGYWRYKAYRHMKKNQIQIEYNSYKKFSWKHSLYATIKAFMFNMVLHLCPNLLQRYYMKEDGWICKY